MTLYIELKSLLRILECSLHKSWRLSENQMIVQQKTMTIEEASRRFVGKTAKILGRKNQASTLNNKITDSIIQRL